MELEVSYSLENEQQFWDELDDIVSAQCQNQGSLDNALRRYLSFAANFSAEYLNTENALARCLYKLFDANLYLSHKDYVRRQIIYGLLQEDDRSTLNLIVAFLLHDGRADESVYEMMQRENAFHRLAALIQSCLDEHTSFRKALLELTYEMSRVRQLAWEDLVVIDDDFILKLFQDIESSSDHFHDPYHYTVIRVLLVLNEQYLVHSTTTASKTPEKVLTNRVIKSLSTDGHKYKTFGENLILLLNRESETSCQLLILKLLYLLFSSPSTSEYFYTNDLHVLLDVILRNLLDLPCDSSSATALRQTYLRVLHPLLVKSQLAQPPFYKRTKIQQVLKLLLESNPTGWQHFGPVDPTTERLVLRCLDVTWLKEDHFSTPESEGNSPTSPIASKPNTQKLLGMSVPGAVQNNRSVIDLASQSEKPGVQAPSNNRHFKYPTVRKSSLVTESAA